MESAEETTAPAGVERIYHIRSPRIGYEGVYELRKWVGTGSRSIMLDVFFNEEEAKEALFQFHQIEFEQDDQRNTAYYSTLEEAQAAYNESYGLNQD